MMYSPQNEHLLQEQTLNNARRKLHIFVIICIDHALESIYMGILFSLASTCDHKSINFYLINFFLILA